MTLFDGTYTLNHLTPATYEPSVSLKGFQTQTKTVRVEGDEELTLDFCLVRAVGSSRILGCVRNAEGGDPISFGGTVTLILPVANRYASIDGEGCYEFSELAAGAYGLWVSVPGFEEVGATVVVDGAETRVQDFDCPPSKAVEPPWG